METKIRKQIYIDPQQNEILKQSSRKLGISEAEIIRRAIIAQAGRMVSSKKDRAAWKDEQQFLQILLNQGSVTGGRAWKREDLYER